MAVSSEKNFHGQQCRTRWRLSLLQHTVESCIASSVQRAKRAILTEAIEDAARYTSNAATSSEPSAPSSPR